MSDPPSWLLWLTVITFWAPLVVLIPAKMAKPVLWFINRVTP